jgi:large repetitive protein
MIGVAMLRRVALAAIATLAIGASACSSTTTSTTSTLASPPAVTSLKPASGPVGTAVTIKGTNLAGATKVAFNGVTATITKDTAKRIKVKVPVGATTGKIEIVTPKGQAQTATAFTVT